VKPLSEEETHPFGLAGICGVPALPGGTKVQEFLSPPPRRRDGEENPMQPYWVTFEDGSSGSCDGQDAYDAKTIGAKVAGKPVKAVKTLPYPATPIIWQFDHPVRGKCPPFCSTPLSCAGHTSCPKNYACSE